jgi:hypothetical protein
MRPTVDEIEEHFRARFPAYGRTRHDEAKAYDGGELVYVSVRLHEHVTVTLQLIAYDAGNITDIKEQEIQLGFVELTDPKERFFAFIEAWGAVLDDVFTMLPRKHLDYLMPHDLFPRGVLKLAKAKTKEDFDKALRVKSRLGGLLAQT